MKPRKLNHPEEPCFLVPLRDHGFARGVVSRMDGEGVFLGYFFAPRVATPQVAQTDHELRPHNAVLAGKVGDLGLIKGAWPITGLLHGWQRNTWPMPDFVRGDGEVLFKSRYSDDLRLLSEEQLSPNVGVPAGACRDSLMGYGFVEIKLTKLL